MPELWPHQQYTLNAVADAESDGVRRIVVTIPTGGGKTLVMQKLAESFLEMHKRVVLYTNRTFLREQISDGLMDAGIYHGVRAAGEADEREHPFQISSIQTEHSRVIKRKRWDVHAADLVLIDEAHLQKEEMAKSILALHKDALIVGFTATPLGLEEMYDRLIVGATLAQLRKCGALVLSRHFGPDEPDYRDFKKLSSDKLDLKLSDKDAVTVMGPRPQLFGRVWANYEILNPERRPTILFAPGVEESIWFAEQFASKGVRSAHIDGDDVWIDGEFHKSDSDLRRRIVEELRGGSLFVVCNRFVMREGINIPEVSHGIFATVFGSVQTYLQAGGRLLRSAPGKTEATIQDHGGSFGRFGSLNEDREWFLEQTAEMAYAIRAERIRSGKQSQPFLCPKCGRAWTRGRVCLVAHKGCGYELPAKAKKSRPVVTAEGQLRECVGEFFRPRRVNRAPNAIRDWCQLIRFRCKEGTRGERTYRQAAAAYAIDHHWQWPDPSWPLMPINELDWFRKVHDVPPERLTGAPAESATVG